MSLLSAVRPLVFRRGRRFAPIAMLCAAFLLLGAADASAAIRYAAPGGNEEAESECLQAHPCSLFNAASRFAENTKLTQGDEVVIEPGTYSDAAGELGPEEQIAAKENTNIHGVAGQPRPLISVSGNRGGFAFVMDEPGAVLSDVEIVSTGNEAGFSLQSGTVDGVVVRAEKVTACFQSGGLLRNSACLSGDSGGGALGILTLSGTKTAKLRNVTAITTGTNSHGLSAEAFGNAELTVDAVGVLARGSAADVLAKTETGAKVAINLDHSDFAEVEPRIGAGGGAATITAPGSSAAADITAEPLLAADGYHELPGSPTIDAGAVAVDGSSGTTDVDGNQRVIGLADIGADEFPIPSTTPTPVAAGPKAPNTTLKKKPARKTASRQATFAFVSDQAPSRFECKLDKRAFKACRSPFKAKKLKPGHHIFKVRAVNGAGVADPTPAVFRWKVS